MLSSAALLRGVVALVPVGLFSPALACASCAANAVSPVPAAAALDGPCVPPARAVLAPTIVAGLASACLIAETRSNVPSRVITGVIGRTRRMHSQKRRRAAVAARLDHRSLDEAAVYGFCRPFPDRPKRYDSSARKRPLQNTGQRSDELHCSGGVL